jgi:hypothetical protein
MENIKKSLRAEGMTEQRLGVIVLTLQLIKRPEPDYVNE